MNDLLVYSSVLLLGVFIAAVSQVMLKKEAMKEHSSASKEYLNPLVIFAYVLFVGTTFLSIIAYRVACKQGWAPPPKTEAQRIIWKQTHQVPDKPITIEYDPKIDK